MFAIVILHMFALQDLFMEYIAGLILGLLPANE